MYSPVILLFQHEYIYELGLPLQQHMSYSNE